MIQLAGYQGKLPKLRVIDTSRTSNLAQEADQLRALQAQLKEARAEIAQLRAKLAVRKPSVAVATVLRKSVRKVVAVTGDATICQIFGDVEALTGIDRTVICGRDRYAPAVRARALFVGLAAQQGYSLTNIGLAIGLRDHTTIRNLLPRGLEMAAAQASRVIQ